MKGKQLRKRWLVFLISYNHYLKIFLVLKLGKTHRTGPGFYPRVEFHVSGREIIQKGKQKVVVCKYPLTNFALFLCWHITCSKEIDDQKISHTLCICDHHHPSPSASPCSPPSRQAVGRSPPPPPQAESAAGWPQCSSSRPRTLAPHWRQWPALGLWLLHPEREGLDFIFDEKNWSTWTSAHLSEEWETRCWSRVDLREKVLLQWRHVSFGRTLTNGQWPSIDVDMMTFMNKLWILLPRSLTCSLQPWALFPRPLLRPGWFHTWQNHVECYLEFQEEKS